MYKSLSLEKAKHKLRSSIIVGILSFIILIIPFYFLLKPFFLKIGNPDFLIWLSFLTVVSLLGVEFFNQSQLKKITKQFDKNSFIYNLHPLDLVYLKKEKTSDVVKGYINELFSTKIIKANSNKVLEVINNKQAT